MNDIRELTDPIAKKNGKEVISVVAIEECSELQKEITKMMRERGNKMNLLEEMADVYICLAELRQCYGIITQTDLAFEANVSQPTLSEIERGQMPNVSFEALLRVAFALNFDISDICIINFQPNKWWRDRA